MTAKQQDIDDIFTMFHDFEIVKLDLQGKELTMEVELPWAQMWNIFDYKLTFKFYECDRLHCLYYRRINNNITGPVTTPDPSEEIETTDLDVIENLELDVQRHKFEEPDVYLLYCNSMTDRIEFATLRLNASDYKIMDNAGKEMTLNKMKEWATEWWEGIQKCGTKKRRIKHTPTQAKCNCRSGSLIVH